MVRKSGAVGLITSHDDSFETDMVRRRFHWKTAWNSYKRDGNITDAIMSAYVSHCDVVSLSFHLKSKATPLTTSSTQQPHPKVRRSPPRRRPTLARRPLSRCTWSQPGTLSVAHACKPPCHFCCRVLYTSLFNTNPTCCYLQMSTHPAVKQVQDKVVYHMDQLDKEVREFDVLPVFLLHSN